MNGKDNRMRRIFTNGKTVIVPMDHGTSDGPIDGLININEMVSKISEAGASSIVLHKGLIKSLNKPPNCGLIMHLSASTKIALDPNNKVQVSSVEEAIRLGADAVSVHINIGGSASEPEMIKILGQVAKDCDYFQIPLLAMMYPRGDNVKDKLNPELVALVARVGAELGADIIKTVYTGDINSFKKVVEGCPVPIVIAGGPKCNNDKETLRMVKNAMISGAKGVSLGRNVFQHSNPVAMIKALKSIIIDGTDVDTALTFLKEV